MIAPGHVVLMAAYNEWMNDRLYAAAGKLTAAELAADRKAFFGSILGTLNHIVVGDTLWLKRFATHPAHHAALDPVRALPAPAALDQLLFTDFAQLRAHRGLLDKVIKAWAAALSEDDLLHVLHYFRRRAPLPFTLAAMTVDPMAGDFDPSTMIPYLAALGGDADGTTWIHLPVLGVMAEVGRVGMPQETD